MHSGLKALRQTMCQRLYVQCCSITTIYLKLWGTFIQATLVLMVSSLGRGDIQYRSLLLFASNDPFVLFLLCLLNKICDTGYLK